MAFAICWHSAACLRNSSAGLMGVMDAHFWVSRPLLTPYWWPTERGNRLLNRQAWQSAYPLRPTSSSPAHAFHLSHAACGCAFASYRLGSPSDSACRLAVQAERSVHPYSGGLPIPS